MVGYLDRPDATAKVLKDGWYCTGDLGYLDPEGFLKLTGRLSRFAKIGGEMVPLKPSSRPFRAPPGSMNSACRHDRPRLQARRAPGRPLHRPGHDARGCLPEADLRVATQALDSVRADFVHVEEIPALGVGKRDLRRLKELAAEKLAG